MTPDLSTIQEGDTVAVLGAGHLGRANFRATVTHATRCYLHLNDGSRHHRSTGRRVGDKGNANRGPVYAYHPDHPRALAALDKEGA